jgi:hypothetical protein
MLSDTEIWPDPRNLPTSPNLLTAFTLARFWVKYQRSASRSGSIA